MRDPSVSGILEDLQSAKLFDQKITEDDSSDRIFYITTYTLMTKQRKLTLLMFRTGSFTIARVNEKVVLELIGLRDRSYILYFKNSSEARSFLGCINGADRNEALDITTDLRFYLEHGSLLTRSQNQPESQSSSEPDEDDMCALTLATGSSKHSKRDRNSSRS